MWPHTDYVHFFDGLITVEASLLHAFTRKPGGYPLCARWICNESLEASVAFYEQNTNQIHAELREKNVKDVPDVSPSVTMTLWARTVLIESLLQDYEQTTNYDGFTRTKVRQFIRRHQGSTYEPLGNSEYPDDRSLRKDLRRCTPNHSYVQHQSLITGERVEWYARCIRNGTWSDEELLEMFAPGTHAYDPLDFPRDFASIIRDYSIYCGCILVINRGEGNVHALLDLFYHCLTYEKMLDSHLLGDEHWWSFWYYPLETRVFTADYLPNYFHTLAHMAFCGENDSPDFPLMLIWSKCMPFACQQRDLMKDLYNFCMKNAAFWRFFSKLMWCMLSGLYPNCTPITDMRALLRIKHLCDNRAILLQALCRGGEEPLSAVARKERERNASIVATAFRLYTSHLIRYNPHFAEAFAEVVDWDTFEKEAVAMGDAIRNTNLYLVEDPFMEARKRIASFGKEPDGKRVIYRFRKHSCITTLLSVCNKIIQKVLTPDAEHFAREIEVMQRVGGDLDAYPAIYDYFATVPRETWPDVANSVIPVWQTLLHAIQTNISQTVKERILNWMLRVPRHERLAPRTLAVLQIDRYGGISELSVVVVLRLVDMYYAGAMPKAIEQQFRVIPAQDVRCIAWFLHVCSVLEKVNFAPLDYETVRGIDEAMISVRYPVYPGIQQLNPAVYNVIYTLCCQNLATKLGKSCHGHEDVAYDVLNRQIVCNRSVSGGGGGDGDEGTLEDLAKLVDAESTSSGAAGAGAEIPCFNQPVLQFPVKSCALILGDAAKKKVRYMRCPRCAGE